VHVALAAADTLEADGIGARVVSMPCWELFLRQDEASRRALLGPGTAKVVVEAGIAQGWDRVVGSDAAFIGMDRFGVSAPSPELYAHFGITPDAVASAAKARLKS
ncbi:MAG: transketolase, partial [Alphaproteobacteria bacterium]|nr:transketolase [Alphaproteobacteria bacterium]